MEWTSFVRRSRRWFGVMLGCEGTQLVATISTSTLRHVKAPRVNVYRALLDAREVAKWKVPAGMTCQVHVFDAREGGSFRISLTYDEPTHTGKTTAHTDTYHGRFVELLPNEKVVEVMEFETADPAMSGEMRVTYTVTDTGAGTDVLAVHDNVPPRGLVIRQRDWLAAGPRQTGCIRRGRSVRVTFVTRAVP
jgi:uncharacterized protein YndB with AHSA1/START domain